MLNDSLQRDEAEHLANLQRQARRIMYRREDMSKKRNDHIDVGDAGNDALRVVLV